MNRRKLVLGLVVVAGLTAVVALARKEEKKPPLLLLEWAGKAKLGTPPAAVLVEFGLKDKNPQKYRHRATVRGARVVDREGYRFRAGDKLVKPDAWELSSHRPLRLPRRNPVLARLEGIETVGVVLRLADVKEGATLTVEPLGGGEKASVDLGKVLAGHQQGLFGGAGRVRLVTTATRLTTDKTEDDFPAAAYGPDGTLWVAYIAYRLRDEGRRVEAAQLKEQPKDFKNLYHPEYADQLFVTYCRDGRWSKPAAVTGPNEDLMRCAIAVEKDRSAWVAYSAHRKGNFDIYARKLDLNTPEMVSHPAPRVGEEVRLTDNPGPDVNPVMVTGQKGGLFLAGPSWTSKTREGWYLATCEAGKWDKKEAAAGEREGSSWSLSVVATPNPGVAFASDAYLGGDYDVAMGATGGEGGGIGVATSSRFEARPSLTCDPAGRVWIAYEEGPTRWGKDYGALDAGAGHPLYDERSARVVCLEDGKLMKPAAELATAKYEAPRIPFNRQKTNGFERGTRYAYPKIGIDGKGRVWVVYREKFGSRYSSHPGSYWLSFARCLIGDKWSDPIEVHHSDGLLDYRPVLLPHPAGGLLIVHNTDGRYTTPNDVQNRVYTSYVDLPGDAVAPKLVPHKAGKKDPATVKEHKKEQEDVKRIRTYRVKAGGKEYQLLRGEFHRHTEVSWDGGADGSLEDMFRYAVDAASLDWIGNTDHDNGAGREYPWWLTQKLTDAYHVSRRFTPMFAYERSVSYPHGHRNCVFAKRGVMTLPRLAEPDPKKRVAGINADDTKMLYRYLHELGGICASHTSATGMGTDWRDNDPVVEPLVEIYQGDRMSYEMEEAPRAGYDPKTGKEPANIGGWRPLGFLDNALAKKGYRLSFQSSSDHWSTHISYGIALAEGTDRESILDAMKKRHFYAATDNILVDVRSGEHLMGDAFATREAPTFRIHIAGTAPLASVAVLRDSKVVKELTPKGAGFDGSWTDPAPERGGHYYYVRVVQKDGEIAWGSPMWVSYRE